MPRLLLVDDNPSIHKIAETLLGSSSIELFCVGSASEAMMMLDSGERFDVALLDTAMPGMDGWELLARMRKHPDSAFIPIAMMAGVLDTVDPEKLKNAPIQGFIKKPIELRELAERVQQLLATPVTIAENEGSSEGPTVLSPFATVPGTKFKSLPEFRGVVDGPPPEEIQPRATSYFEESPETVQTDGQDDVLLLTPEDFWFEDAQIETDSPDFLLAQATAQAMAKAEHEAPLQLTAHVDATLDLEELDLEALKDLPNDEPPTLPDVPVVPETPYGQRPEDLPEQPFGEAVERYPDHSEPVLAMEASAITGGLHEDETLAIPGLAIRAQTLAARESNAADFPTHEFLTEAIPTHELSDLGEVPDFEDFTPEISHAEGPVPPLAEGPVPTLAEGPVPTLAEGPVPTLAEGPVPTLFEETEGHAEPNDHPAFPSAAAFALPVAAVALPAALALHAAGESTESPIPSTPIAPIASSLLNPPGVDSEKEVPRDAAALVQVLMSDPVLMDALAKAVVARLGDQALREIAWELMPELAEKLPR